MNRRHALAMSLGGISITEPLMAAAAATAKYAGVANAARPGAKRPAVIRSRDGLELPYSMWGSGPPVLLLHAWALSSAMWSQQVLGLTHAGYSVITFDRRGHGRAPGNGAGYDFDTLADDVAAAIDQLGLSELNLVGHSMGSGEAVRYLSRHGHQKVRRLILLAPITPFLLQTADNPAGLPADIQDKILGEIATDFPKWIAEGTRPFFRPETSRETMSWMAGIMLSTPLPVAHACAQAFMREDFRRNLKAIHVPTLIVHGDHDVSAPLQLTGQRTAEIIPGAKLEVLGGAPHGLFVTDAAEVNRLIVEFTQAHGATDMTATNPRDAV